MSAPNGVYPKREPFFAYRLIRLMAKTCAAQTIGLDGVGLVSLVAMQEDARRYAQPGITYYNGQLMTICAFETHQRLDRLRMKAVRAGWLSYQAGAKRKPGLYWSTIPPYLDGIFDDLPIDESPLSRAPAPQESPLSGAPAPQESPLSGAPAPQESPLSGAPAPQESPLSRAPAPQESPLSRAPAPQESPLSRAPAPQESPLSGAPAPQESPLSGAPAPQESPLSRAP